MAAFVLAVLTVALGAGRASAQTATPIPPRATAVRPLDEQRVFGPVPQCAVQSDVQSSSQVASVGVPFTLTLQVGITCPQLLDGRSIILVLGGLPSAADLDDHRAGLIRILDRFAAGKGNRLALVDVAEPELEAAWATSPAAYAALRTRLENVTARPALTIGAWNAALRVAGARLAEVGIRSRPFLVVVDGTGAATDQALLTERVRALGLDAVNAAGHVILVDLTSDGRLFFPLSDNGSTTAPFVTVFARIRVIFSEFEERIVPVLNAYDAPLSRVATVVLFSSDLSSHTCWPIDTYPSASVTTSSVIQWVQPASGTEARLRFKAVVRLERAMPQASVQGIVLIERLDTEMTIAASPGTFICAAAPGSPPGECPSGPSPGATEEPVSRTCPRRNELWFPRLFRSWLR